MQYRKQSRTKRSFLLDENGNWHEDLLPFGFIILVLLFIIHGLLNTIYAT